MAAFLHIAGFDGGVEVGHRGVPIAQQCGVFLEPLVPLDKRGIPLPGTVVGLLHLEGLDPLLHEHEAVLDMLAQFRHQQLGLVEIGAQPPDAQIALLDLVLQLGEANRWCGDDRP
jgi:hypothetical protein